MNKMKKVKQTIELKMKKVLKLLKHKGVSFEIIDNTIIFNFKLTEKSFQVFLSQMIYSDGIIRKDDFGSENDFIDRVCEIITQYEYNEFFSF